MPAEAMHMGVLSRSLYDTDDGSASVQSPVKTAYSEFKSEAHTWAYNDIVWAALLLPAIKEGSVMVLIHEVLPVIGHCNIAAHACVRKVHSAGLLIEIAGHAIVGRWLVPQAPARLAAAAVLRVVQGLPHILTQLQMRHKRNQHPSMVSHCFVHSACHAGGMCCARHCLLFPRRLPGWLLQLCCP